MVADTDTGTAVVVDPQRDIDQYLQDATRQGWQIRYVFLTHFHADFLAGHLELRDRVGATICLGARADAEYAFRPFADGDTLEFGAVRLRILETPGHTPESISILVFDLHHDANTPQAVLTGDTLFIGDVGRPDLLGSVGMTADELAGMLYDSLHQKLLRLPDATLVYPAHGAGSMCGKNLSPDTVSPLGVQRRCNYALQPMPRAAFIRLVTADQPEAPAYFAYDAMLNRRQRPTLDQALARELTPLSLEAVLGLQNGGATVLDVRDPTDFEGAHLAGSVNIGLGGSYATWAGTVLGRGQPLVLIAEPGRETEAALRLGRIGFDTVAGYLDGGMHALVCRPDMLRHTARITAPALAQQLAQPIPPLVLDVHTPRKWGDKHIAGSVNIPLNHLEERLSEIPPQRHIVVHCAGGYRSAIAVSLLERHGHTALADLVGGFAAWEAAQDATVGVRHGAAVVQTTP
jgi:hydroxyacylglutathione hydrolase